jgi:oxygen-independent coproporphyrinogen-3 oxidase
MFNQIPLSLYIHIPWCVKKCPYCDFNSHAIKDGIPEEAYIETLLRDLTQDLPLVQNRPIKSIFLGGGTPSLFSPKSIEKIINHAQSLLKFQSDIEITMEANPGTVEHKSFSDYRLAGVTRISLGAQSFQDEKLLKLGRIHKADETKRAIELISFANFKSFNIDLMYGLPNQSFEDAMFDLETALSFSPPHISWYNLTIEPNTIFHHEKPPLPPDEDIADMQAAGFELLQSKGLNQYEVSAFAKPDHQCQHNLNYWEFGDYLGIGAGAHAKITNANENTITRFWKTRYPQSYLNPNYPFLAGSNVISPAELPLEFMLNGLRLMDGIPMEYFEKRTGLSIDKILPILEKAILLDFLAMDNGKIIPTELGKNFLNDLLELFLPQNDNRVVEEPVIEEILIER